MRTDRTVHAEWGDMKLVRYDKAGKWFIEYDPPRLRSARQIRLHDAALLALEMVRHGGQIMLGKPGGAAFDRSVKRAHEDSE